MTKVAIIFDMLGPYHLARLKALGSKVDLTAIEICARSKVYAWQPTIGGANIERRTLFNVADSSKIPTRTLARALTQSLYQARPDVVLIPGWASIAAFAALAWCKSNRVPAIVMSESTSWDNTRIVWKEALKRRLVRAFSAGLVGGDPQARYLESLGLPKAAIALGYNAVDNEHFQAGAAEARRSDAGTRRHLSLPGRYILASARFIGIKNLPVLIEAYAQFRVAHPDTKLHLVLLGDGPDRALIEEKRRSLGLEHSLVLPGFQQYDTLPLYYGLAEAFLHVSRVEPWGLVVNEAMAAGLPVIVSRACGCAESLVKHEVNGFVFDHNDTASLSAAIAALEGDDQLRQTMGCHSSEIVASWGPDRFASGACEAIEYESWLRLSEQFPAKDKWCSAEFHL